MNPGPPATAEPGLNPVVDGTGLLPDAIVKVWAFDVPPPGAGVNTVTAAVPATPRSAAGIAAVTCVVETNVVARAAPFQRTTELGTKFVPLTVSVRPGPPAAAEAGLSPVVAGIGLDTAIVTVAPPVNPATLWGVPSVSAWNSKTSVAIGCLSAVVASPVKVRVRVPPVTCAAVSAERARAIM